jgi:hypothetical protein
MKTRLATTIAAAALLWAAPSAMFGQEFTITQTTTSSGAMGQGGGSSTETVYFGTHAIKQASADGKDFIMLFDQRKIITVDNNRKTYSEMTFEQMQQALDKALAGIAGNAQAMEAMKKMMGRSGAPVAVTKEGAGGTIAGYPTEKYRITGPVEMEIWAAPDLKVPVAYYDSLPLRMPPNPMFDARELSKAYKQIEGWPMKTVLNIRMMGMSMTTTTEVSSVRKGAIPAATFAVPAGYKLVQEKF